MRNKDFICTRNVTTIGSMYVGQLFQSADYWLYSYLCCWSIEGFSDN